MRKKIALIGLVIGLIPLGWLIDDIPYNIDVTAKIYPAQKWVLLKDTDGSLISTLYNYKAGSLSNVRSYKLGNGDVAHVELKPAITKDVYFHSGDTVAFLHSALIDERIAIVNSQLEELQAFLKVDETGGKVSEIAQAREQMRFVEQQLELETENYARALALYQQNVIAQAEYSLQEARFVQAKTQVEIAKRYLETANSGVKPEQIKYTKSRIQTAIKELEALKKQKGSYTIIAPINGKANFNVTLEEVLAIEDTSQYILHFPIRLQDKKFISSFSKLSISYTFGAEAMVGSLVDLSDRVEYMAGEQLVFAKAILDKKSPEVASGMFLSCKIECDRVNLFEYIFRVLRQSLR
jgi:hypothetical protein